MQTSGFTSAPSVLVMLVTVTTLSVVGSITSMKQQVGLRPTPDLYPYLQLHRTVTHQVAYTSSSELVFSAVLLYQFRVVERLLGTRKFVSLVLVSALCNAVVTPALVLAVVRPLSLGRWDYVPAGATATVFALLAVWAFEVPRLWTWEIVVSSPVGRGRGRGRGRPRHPPTNLPPPSAADAATAAAATAAATATAPLLPDQQPTTLTFSDGSITYLLALQLALTQFPYTLLPAAVGYLVGLAWTADFLPGRMSSWRVPRWLVGEVPLFGRDKGHGRRGWGSDAGGVERERYESLRRRLEEEGGRGGDGDGMRQAAHGQTIVGGGGGGGGGTPGGTSTTARRPMGAQIADFLRGVF